MFDQVHTISVSANFYKNQCNHIGSLYYCSLNYLIVVVHYYYVLLCFLSL